MANLTIPRNRAQKDMQSASDAFKKRANAHFAVLAEALDRKLSELGAEAILRGNTAFSKGFKLWLPHGANMAPGINAGLSRLSDPRLDITGFVNDMNSWLKASIWESHASVLSSTDKYLQALDYRGEWEHRVFPGISNGLLLTLRHSSGYRHSMRNLRNSAEKANDYMELVGDAISHAALASSMSSDLSDISDVIKQAARPY